MSPGTHVLCPDGAHGVFVENTSIGTARVWKFPPKVEQYSPEALREAEDVPDQIIPQLDNLYTIFKVVKKNR